MTVVEHARPAARHRLRRALPRGPPPRRRPDPARTSTTSRTGSTTSRRSILTHGHEDHIGAVPYLLRLKPDIPLVGSTLTLALVEAKLKEHRIKPYTLGVREGDREQLGRLRLRVRRGQPLDPRRARRRRAHLRRHAAAHRRLQDGPAAARRPAHRPARASRGWGRRASTSSSPTPPTPRCPASPRPSATSSSAIDKVFRHAERRIIVACFSSHVHRVQQVLDAAEKAGRKVAMVGRSMVRNMGIAADLGYLHVPDGVLVDVKKLDDLRRRQGRAGLHRQPGRADGRPVADGQPRPPHRRRPRRHRAARELAHPRQRERRLPRHQRPDAPGRQRRAQGQRQGARLRPRQRRRAALLLQHRQAAATSCRCTASGATSWPTPSSPSPPASRATGVVVVEDGVVVDLVDGRASVVGCGAVRLRLRRRLRRWARPTRPCSRTAASCATRASSP